MRRVPALPRAAGRRRPSALLRGDLRRARRLQRMIEVAEDVVDVLDADRQAHVTFGHAGGELVLGRKLRVGRRRRMDGERARVADVGDVVEQLQRVDEPPPRLMPAGEFEADQAAEAALEILLRALERPAASAARDRSPWSLPAAWRAIGDRLGVLAVALDAQRHRLDALDGEEGVERRDAAPRSRSSVTRALRM